MKILKIQVVLIVAVLASNTLFGSLVVVELDKYQQLFQNIFKKIEQPINNIIKQELDRALEHEKRTPAFYPTVHTPHSFHMSLAYVYGLRPQHFDAAVQGLDLMQSLGRGKQEVYNVMISNNFDFFGKFHDFLILKVNDSKGTLYRLHYDIKQMLQHMHRYFARGTKRQLFSLEKLNEFYFNPHVTLAIFPIRKIKQVLHMPKSESDLILDTMRQRIVDEVLKDITISQEQSKLDINSFCVWGKKRNVLKTYNLAGQKQSTSFLDSVYQYVLGLWHRFI